MVTVSKSKMFVTQTMLYIAMQCDVFSRRMNIMRSYHVNPNKINHYILVESAGTSPYEVTELVAKKNRPNKGSNRETVHQVPQAISSQAAKKHKSKGD